LAALRVVDDDARSAGAFLVALEVAQRVQQARLFVRRDMNRVEETDLFTDHRVEPGWRDLFDGCGRGVRRQRPLEALVLCGATRRDGEAEGNS
jgi:hypothetical protein